MKVAKKAMKAKAMKAKKTMKAKRVSKIAKGKRAYSSVWKGSKQKTVGGLKKTDLKKNKAGKIVSAKRSIQAKKSSGYKKIAAWAAATSKARKSLGIKGFVAIGGKSKQGQALLAKVRSFYKK